MKIEADLKDICDVIESILYDSFEECTQLQGYQLAMMMVEELIKLDNRKESEDE